MAQQVAKIHFYPAHGLDIRAREIISEFEMVSQRWPDVMRHVTLYIDTDGYYAVFVCFTPKGHAGHMDLTRCFRGPIAPQAELGDPVAAIGSFEQVADAVEEEFAARLAKFYGAPGTCHPETYNAK